MESGSFRIRQACLGDPDNFGPWLGVEQWRLQHQYAARLTPFEVSNVERGQARKNGMVATSF